MPRKGAKRGNCREKVRKGVMPVCLGACLPSPALPCPALPCLPACLPADFISSLFPWVRLLCFRGKVAHLRHFSQDLRGKSRTALLRALAAKNAFAPFPAKSARILVWRRFSVDEPDPICLWGAFPTRRARKSACRLIASLPLGRGWAPARFDAVFLGTRRGSGRAAARGPVSRELRRPRASTKGWSLTVCYSCFWS